MRGCPSPVDKSPLTTCRASVSYRDLSIGRHCPQLCAKSPAQLGEHDVIRTVSRF